MVDRITISDLLLRTIIGINDEERRNRQDVILNLVLYTDTRAAGQSDDIADTVNYRTLTKRIIRLVEQSQFFLVERLAAEVAAACLADPRVERVTVAVDKPGALRFARSVGVCIDRARAPRRVLVSLGSNVDADRNLPEAIRRLAARCRLLAVSSAYETTPVGTATPEPFLNAAALIETELDPVRLKAEVLAPIERELGRVRTADKYAPRTIDLDISLVSGAIVDAGGRHIPDPDILRFAHIAVPLADVAPDECHPETGQTLREIAAALSASGVQRRPDVVLCPAGHDSATKERD